MESKTIWTIGHSTRTLSEFVAILKAYGIRRLVDVRTVPRSRTNPQFNRDELAVVLPREGIAYAHAADLGGLRRTRKDSPNTGWHNHSFRGYADYMQTREFDDALQRLAELALEQPTALMCAEVLPWRCHRSLIADALSVRGFDVEEIFDEKSFRPHKITPFAAVTDGRIQYPGRPDEEGA